MCVYSIWVKFFCSFALSVWLVASCAFLSILFICWDLARLCRLFPVPLSTSHLYFVSCVFSLSCHFLFYTYKSFTYANSLIISLSIRRLHFLMRTIIIITIIMITLRFRVQKLLQHLPIGIVNNRLFAADSVRFVYIDCMHAYMRQSCKTTLWMAWQADQNWVAK